MAKERNRLKDVVVRRLLGRKQPEMHPDGAGLYLRIRDGGGASWTFRYKLHGNDRWLDIGDPRDTSLASARVLARAERGKLDEGRDPIEECRALDNYLLKILGRTPVAEVKAADCARLLDEVRAKHPTTANDLLRHLKAIFAFGIRRHRVDASPVAAFVAAKDAGGKEESRTRALSRAELGQLFKAIRAEPTFGGDNLLLVRLLLALCVRKGELFAAKWDEFDLDGKTDDGPVPTLEDVLRWVTELANGQPDTFAELDVQPNSSKSIFV